MKAKNILMTLLLVTGAIAAKASGYPPELALVSQPVMVYNYNSVTVYYDVENIGDYTYRGYVYLYLDPDDGYYYAREYVRVYPGRIKRIAVEIPAYRANPGWIYTVMPYYELDRELFSFTTFEYFEPLEFWWNGPRTHHYIVINVPPRPRYYRRPGTYRYYYDGFRPPMPPHGPMPPMDPHHHTYGYHHEHGGYPANHWNEGSASGSNNNEAPSATVRPKANAGSMSSGSYNNGSNPPAPVNNGSNSGRINSGSDSGRTGNTGSNSGRIDNGGTNSGNTGSSSGRTGNNSGTSRVNNGSSNSSSSSSGRTGNSSGTSRVSNGSSSSSSSGRTGNSSSGSSRVNNRSSSSSSSSSGRTGNSSGSSRVSNGSSSTRSSGTSSSGSSSTRSSSSSSRSSGSSSTRSGNNGSSSGRR